jgi:hypothetical protein
VLAIEETGVETVDPEENEELLALEDEVAARPSKKDYPFRMHATPSINGNQAYSHGQEAFNLDILHPRLDASHIGFGKQKRPARRMAHKLGVRHRRI